MALLAFAFKWDHTARRFLVWMAVGTTFIAALVAADYFGAIAIP